MENRVTHGKVVPGTDIVAVDAVAKLASVDFTSTTRVMLALLAIAKVQGVSIDSLFDYSSLPLEQYNNERFVAVEKYMDTAVHRLQKNDMRQIANDLRINRRFMQPLRLKKSF